VTSEIRYARSDDVYIAYQTLGDGPFDIIVIMDGFIPVDTMDDEPRLARGMRRLAAFARVIRFDRRGIGLSDPITPSSPPTLEQWCDDARAVLDAAGSTDAVVLAASEASPVALLFAATHAERVRALVLVNAFASVLADDDLPEGMSPAELQAVLDHTDPSDEVTVDGVSQWVPSAANDPDFRRWWQETGRRGASPATARALLGVAMGADVRAVLPAIRVPVFLAYLTEAPERPGASNLASRMPDAKVVELPGRDSYWWAAERAAEILDEIEEFLTGVRAGRSADRKLATLLFTDIADSTSRSSELGDAKWRVLLDQHDRALRRQFVRFRGQEVNTTGDGFVATFDGPARAIDCALAIRDAARQLGIDVRSGVHTGEVEVRGDDIAGIAVHIAARVAARAEPNTVWTSRTVVDLVVGSGFNFNDEGEHTLKGVPGTWQLYSVAQ
jgi:class 3 adenylate cyclase